MKINYIFDDTYFSFKNIGEQFLKNKCSVDQDYHSPDF